MVRRLLVLDGPFEHAFEFLGDDLLFDQDLICAAAVGFHAAGDEATAGDDFDGRAELPRDPYSLEDGGVTGNGKDEEGGMFDAGPLEGVGVADVALDDVNADVGA